MNFLHFISRHFLLFLLAFAIACSNQQAGNSAETGNPEIAGVFLLANGKAAAHTLVRCIPTNFDPYTDTLSAINHTFTDSLGYFLLDSIPKQSCNLEGLHEASGDRVMIQQLNADELINLRIQATLSPAGSARIGLNKKLGLQDGDSAIAFVKGTSILKKVIVKYASIVIDSLPNSLLDSISLVSNTLEPTVIANDLQIESGETVEFETSSIRQEWILDLSAGFITSNLTDTIVGFPMVWRPDSSELNFQFIKPTKGYFSAFRASQELFIDVNHWNTSEREASLWIRLDTLLPPASEQSIRIIFNENTDSLTMRVGNHYTRTDSVAAVWHLEESSDEYSQNSPIMDIKDDGPFGWHGDGYGIKSQEGMVGQGFWFDGSNSYINIPGSEEGELNFAFQGPATFSVWVRLDAPTTSRFIFGKGSAQYHLKYQYPRGWLFENNSDEDPTSYYWLEAPYDTIADQGKWFHLAVVIDSSSQQLYVNGKFADSTAASSPASKQRSTEFPFQIGRRIDPELSNGQYFWGVIDELTIWNKVQSKEWIQLLYNNQKNENYWP